MPESCVRHRQAIAPAVRDVRVALLDCDATVHDVAREPGGDHAGIVVAVTSEGGVIASRRSIMARLGSVGVLMNNAGVARVGPAAE